MAITGAWDRENEATLRGEEETDCPSSALCGRHPWVPWGLLSHQVSGHKTGSLQGVISELPVSVAQTRQQKRSSEPGGTY